MKFAIFLRTPLIYRTSPVAASAETGVFGTLPSSYDGAFFKNI